MKNKNLGRIMMAALLTTSAVAPALALDYEAKPVAWVLAAPIRTAGALAGATVCGVVSGPIDGGWHGAVKGTRHVAGKFGDEKGTGQLVAAVPIGGTAGLVVGGGCGALNGAKHGWKVGWDKPFSRWSFITMEEK